MKVTVYNCRKDERAFFDKYAKEYGAQLVITKDRPSLETAELALGSDCVNIISDTAITPPLLEAFKAAGVKLIATRTIRYDHIDVAYAHSIGLAVTNISYSPNSVADYAIMLMLMVLRKIKAIMMRALGQDYSLSAIRGRELPNMTVGILGTGKIGATVARHLAGFGCRILAHTLFPDESLRQILTYVDLDTLYRESDILTLHLPASQDTVHMINQQAFDKMKDGAILINTARGALVENEALIQALESGKLSGAGLDVVDGDREIYYKDKKYVTIPHREMAILNAMPNVLLLPHMAFYTDQAVSDMVENSLAGCAVFLEGKEPEGLIRA